MRARAEKSRGDWGGLFFSRQNRHAKQARAWVPYGKDPQVAKRALGTERDGHDGYYCDANMTLQNGAWHTRHVGCYCDVLR